MSRVMTNRSQFVIDEESSRKLDAIARDFGRKTGSVKVSRSEAIRLLIANYRLPARLVEQPTTVDTTKE